MTGLLIAGGLALLAGIALALFARVGKTGWEPIAAALLIGIAGYAWQGRPELAGAPTAAVNIQKLQFDERLVDKRRSMENRFAPGAQWLVLSDGLARQGNTADAANVLMRGLKAEPRSADLWVGLGNALVLHGEGVLSPAAEYAYQQAMRLAPAAYGPRYFYALALAQSGKLEPARALWAEEAASLPEGTPFRAELERNVATIDAMLARQGTMGPMGQ